MVMHRVAPHTSGFRGPSRLDGAGVPAKEPIWGAPEPPQGFPDRVYLLAAAVFKKMCPEKATSQKAAISYGKKVERCVPHARDEGAQRQAYELAFNALKYQDLLEDMLVDSCFYPSHPLPDDLMSLAVVMLYDFQERKFLPRSGLGCELEEKLEDVRKAESCLLRFKTKLAASLARCRVKLDLVNIDWILPEVVRTKQERATSLPLYAWVNTLKTSLEDVCDVLKRAGISQAESLSQLETPAFCLDPHCRDVLVFSPKLRTSLYETDLLSEHKLVVQDKCCSLVSSAVLGTLEEGSDVLVAGPTSAFTVAHLAVLATPLFGKVFYCAGYLSPIQREEVQETLSHMECSNVQLIPESFSDLSPSDPRLQNTRVILLMPQCSMSAISNPVEFILHENGDTELLQDLSQGTISPERLDLLAAGQTQDLTHAQKFAKVQAVVYCTSSSYPEENEDVVRRVLGRKMENSKLRPFRLSPPDLGTFAGERDAEEKFFKLEPSKESNGCFLAVLIREPEKKEMAEGILEKAAAKGLLDGLVQTQPAKKKKRKVLRKGLHRQTTTPGSSSNQPQAGPAKDKSSAPSKVLQASAEGQRPQVVPSKSKSKTTCRPPAKTLPSATGKVIGATATVTKQRPASSRLIVTAKPPAPPPPKGRQEVLKPMVVVLPPVMFPSFTSVSATTKNPPLHRVPPNIQFRWKPNSQPAACPSPLSSCSLYRAAVQHPRPWL
ncbi:putative methyltransferase NSUN7 [Scleropages formosus]|uniref:NOP2/Sun RNA methyltransferase family member 7 n=1 Tax=Scleropages formosus TaxID=113540 RepID=A0A8C9SPU9_SCLFO|nr:putative methyltransferase NSUN7 [Scleropages formosus]XP_018601675.2 putative methyltransferase NSUN7 [Scleropages formosus]